MTNLSLETIAQRFERFATDETVASSPLYTHLSLNIAKDPALLELAGNTQAGQPVPNMLFGAVHMLLLRGENHPLADYYPSLHPVNFLQDDPFPAFREFCLQFQADIVPILQTRLVQTNEVRRCACWLPAFGYLAALAQKPFYMVEIGSSAGLNLLWDNWGYDYGEYGRYGNLASPLQLTCEVEGDKPPPFPPILPVVAARTGIDLNPLAVTNPQDVLWLRALIWPEHHHRAQVLQHALELAKLTPPHILHGSALDLLPPVLAVAPQNTAICIYHSFTLNQFSPEMREQLYAIIAENARQNPVYLLGMESRKGQHPRITLDTFYNTTRQQQTLARCNAHGAWLEWQLEG
jgi:hypothetical protein